MIVSVVQLVNPHLRALQNAQIVIARPENHAQIFPVRAQTAKLVRRVNSPRAVTLYALIVLLGVSQRRVQASARTALRECTRTHLEHKPALIAHAQKGQPAALHPRVQLTTAKAVKSADFAVVELLNLVIARVQRVSFAPLIPQIRLRVVYRALQARSALAERPIAPHVRARRALHVLLNRPLHQAIASLALQVAGRVVTQHSALLARAPAVLRAPRVPEQAQATACNVSLVTTVTANLRCASRVDATPGLRQR